MTGGRFKNVSVICILFIEDTGDHEKGYVTPSVKSRSDCFWVTAQIIAYSGGCEAPHMSMGSGDFRKNRMCTTAVEHWGHHGVSRKTLPYSNRQWPRCNILTVVC